MAQPIPRELMNLIHSGENASVEFKQSKMGVPKDIYQTVCAFSNRDGGHIFLGVRDDGAVVGIEKRVVGKVRKEFIASVNNENKIHPALYLTPIEYEADGRSILYINVPASQDVCRCNGRIFDRNHEADIDITYHSDEVYRLYARKSGGCFVNKVFPVFGVDDLRQDLIERARNMTRCHAKEHPWLRMSNEEVVRSSGLVLKDPRTGKEGITLAAILLFGTDQLIMSVLPQHKTDAIFRVFNTDRYDDRDVVTTNLIESYDRLVAFGAKHLNDTFQLEGIVRVSARDQILREIVSNILAHRDFSNAYVAKLVIERNRIYTENANLSHGQGPLDIATFKPVPKNPPISKVFREIGLADELGSGMRNTWKYTKMYSNAEPEFVEGDVFRITIPLNEVATATVGPKMATSGAGAGNPENETITTGNETLNSENGTLKLDNGTLNSENGTLKLESEAANPENGTITTENETLKPENGTLNLDNGTLNSENGTLNQRNETLNSENGTLKLESEAANPENETLNSENGTLKLEFGAVDLGFNSQRILSAIKADRHITVAILASSLGIGRSTVNRSLRVLRDRGLIKRIGSKKSGFWKIKS